jgi:hypothetical protein
MPRKSPTGPITKPATTRKGELEVGMVDPRSETIGNARLMGPSPNTRPDTISPASTTRVEAIDKSSKSSRGRERRSASQRRADQGQGVARRRGS